ncbi:MAG TPA: hypothetical protein VKD72_30300 [Gemmataceae bacterium]|nr:hypothetical protein [Gemmataceae bacterium]
MFKWVCLLVAVAALSAYGWMLNDIRLQIRGLTQQADQHLPRILTETEQVTTKLDQNLPRLLGAAERASTTINDQLPRLLANAGTTADNLADLSDNFAQYKGLMGTVHAANQNKELFSYGSSILDLIAGQNATLGTRRAGSDSGTKQAMPAKQWASAARKENHFLSLVAASKADVLHGLARTSSAAPWFIKLENQAPRLLADWIKEVHPSSKGVN